MSNIFHMQESWDKHFYTGRDKHFFTGGNNIFTKEGEAIFDVGEGSSDDDVDLEEGELVSEANTLEKQTNK